ncbi:galactokinase [Pseudoalteromonas sp. NBT06-2]|uniref:galactokinase n=1 Tax=Pseudoalteromonas sp. NBT06-2 TaxID=2025950 RepID=UPI000BA76226|nr:galactokinase [Pseudoalteromonas sp. NBT06-2]PAJ75320.1 galactokinase [Pseudoalteromonas sp. NBT06-2]
MNLESLNKKFEAIFSCKPQGIASSPGRVNIIGEFTDYNDGFVLPCALEFNTKVAFSPRADNQVVVHSLQYPNEKDNFSLSTDITQGNSQWGNYIRAVAFVLKRSGAQLTGINLLIESNVPQGAGLSSSAALEVAVGGAFNHVNKLGLNEQALALFGQQAENDFMDCQCGIMDQLISAKGQVNNALLIDCESLETSSVFLPDDLSLVIINSNYPRKLVESEYNQRRIDCEQAAKKMSVNTLRHSTIKMLDAVKKDLTINEYKRAHHVITENIRVIKATDALKNNDIGSLREQMNESHQSLKNDFEVTVPATDGLVEICKEALQERGAVRMTGGGFGGAIICLCRAEDIAVIRKAVKNNYAQNFNLEASIFVCQAGEGLTIIE